MADNARAGHRNRMRESFIKNGANSLKDNDLLELYLSLIIPRKDVKPYVYELMRKFGSIEGVFNADYDELKKIDGIGENVAVISKLINQLSKRVSDEKIGVGTDVGDLDIRQNVISALTHSIAKDGIIVIALNLNKIIVDYRFYSDSSINDPQTRMDILEMLFNANATNFIVVHYDKDGTGEIGLKELDTMLNTRDLMLDVDIYLTDWVEMSSQKISMASKSAEYKLMLR